MRRFVPSFATLAVVLLALGSAGPAAAGGAEGAYSRFNTSTTKGLVFLDYDGPTTVEGGFASFGVSDEKYHITGRTIGCSGTPKAANRVFRIERMTDADGGLFFRASPNLGAMVRSIWIGRVDQPGSTVCSMSSNYARLAYAAGGDANGDGAIGGTDFALILVEKRPDSRARVSVVFDDTSGSESIKVRGVNRACGKKPTNSFFDVFVTDFKSKTVDMSQAELNSLRSVRYRESDLSFGCAPLSIIAILIG